MGGDGPGGQGVGGDLGAAGASTGGEPGGGGGDVDGGAGGDGGSASPPCPPPTFGDNSSCHRELDFMAPPSFEAAAYYSICSADFNNDGLLDVATRSPQTVNILFGSELGGFEPFQSLSISKDPRGVGAGDFDRDGNMDIAATTYDQDVEGGGMDVLLGNGDGTFQRLHSYDAGPGYPGSPVATDVNGDDQLDLLVGSYDGGMLYLLLGNGDGTFQLPMWIDAGHTIGIFVAEDLDGDGTVDLVVADGGPLEPQPDAECPSGCARILLGNGDGTFQLRSLMDGKGKVVVGDLDNDHVPDLCVGLQGSTQTQIYRGNGDGTFSPSVLMDNSSTAMPAMAVDLNNDRVLDLVGPDYERDEVVAWLGLGDGTFQPPKASGLAGFLVAARFDADEYTDLAVAQGRVVLLLGQGDGTFPSLPSFTPSEPPLAIASGDFDGDGGVDLVTIHGNGSAEVFLGVGDGFFSSPVVSPSSGYTSAVAAADFNGDEKLDIATVTTAEDFSEIVAVRLGNGDGNLKEGTGFAPGGPLAVGDFNRDELLDVAVADFARVTLVFNTTPCERLGHSEEGLVR